MRPALIEASGQACLYFGTFNPIHNGHLMIAQAALTQFGSTLGFDSVLFIPAGEPPHRRHETDLLAARQRFQMVRLATQSHPGFQVSDIELKRLGKSYTFETVQALKAQGHIQSPVPIIIGADALGALASWFQPEMLIQSALFLQAPRPDYAFVKTIQLHGNDIQLNTEPIEMPLLALSSSWIRQSIQQTQGYQAIRCFVPEVVRAYLADNQLYL